MVSSQFRILIFGLLQVDYNNKIFGLFPRVWLEDKKSYVESSTRKYDKMAFKYLSWAFFPLVLCYGVYSLLYEEHKGWYSWVLGMLYGFLLTFGMKYFHLVSHKCSQGRKSFHMM